MQDHQLILRYFPDLNDRQREQFVRLGALYAEWNEHINVISRKDIHNLYLHHVLHSLAIARVVSFLPGTRMLDVGTGGGFPGIPLAILFPESSFHLVDSIGKKITVVNAIATELSLGNVRGEQIRAEQLKTKYDFVVSRAVTRLAEFYGWVGKLINPESRHKIANGILYLKGGDLAQELEELAKPAHCYPITEFFDEEFFETKFVVHIPA